MCCEAWCCPYVAVLTNRDLIMYKYEVDFDPCDEFIITCVICLDCIFSILALIDDSFRDLRDIFELLLLIIMSCSLAQQESKLDVVTKEPTICGGNFIANHEMHENVTIETYGQQPNYGQPQQPAVNYGQQPNYGQPQKPAVNYGQQPNYGQPPVNYGQPNYGQPNYGQPAPAYGNNTGFA